MVEIGKKLMYSGKVVVFGQSCFIRAKLFYSGKICCIWGKVVLFVQNCCI